MLNCLYSYGLKVFVLYFPCESWMITLFLLLVCCLVKSLGVYVWLFSLKSSVTITKPSQVQLLFCVNLTRESLGSYRGNDKLCCSANK